MLSSYLAELKKIKMLDKDTELQLWHRCAQGDSAAHNLLMRSYQPLVFKTALGFHLSGAQTLELVQEGTIGLLEAAERYDVSKGVAFSIFAIHRVRGRMVDYLQKEYGDKTLSLNMELGESGDAWEDFLVAPGYSIDEQAERHLLSDKVLAAMERLPAKEKTVLTAIYIDDKRPVDIAETIHVTTAHVYRLQKQGVRRIRGMLSRFMAELKK
jgi:RNA polymerase sigma factor (sigma-70 family)